MYLIGGGRVFGYDSAVTFANFVATPNLLDALAISTQQPTIPLAQIAGNDHVLVSLVSHLIYSVSGTRSELVYRLLPALAAGGTVGLATTVLSHRFGLLAGIPAGLYIATNPMFVENSRDLRGYSLAAFCGLLATVLFFGPRTRGRLVLYGVVLGLAIAAHAYAGLVLLAHILWVDATQHGFLPSLFTATFPEDLTFFLLGARSLLAVGLWLSTFGLGLWVLRRDRLMWAALLLVVVVTAVLWLVVQPFYLYPRFFIVAVPGVAFVLAAAIQRWKVLAPVVVLGAVAAAVTEVPDYTTDPLALRQAAAVVADAGAQGRRVCLIHSDEQVLGAYAASGFKVVTSAAQLNDCDVVVVASWGIDIPIRDQAAREFPKRTLLPAVYPTVVLER